MAILNQNPGPSTLETQEIPIPEGPQQNHVAVTHATEYRATNLSVEPDTALAVRQPGTGLDVTIADVHEILQASVAPTGLLDLPRCVLEPQGWKQPNPSGGDMEKCSEVRMVLLGYLDVYRYFQTPYGKGPNGPPQCYSLDLRTGKGIPGSDCTQCELAQFGSDGRGRACRQYRLLFGTRPEDHMLLQADLSRMSIKSSKEYFRRMRARLVPPYAEVTIISFETTEGYPRATFAPGPRLTGEEAQLMRVYYAAMRTLLASIRTGSLERVENEIG